MLTRARACTTCAANRSLCSPNSILFRCRVDSAHFSPCYRPDCAVLCHLRTRSLLNMHFARCHPPRGHLTISTIFMWIIRNSIQLNINSYADCISFCDLCAEYANPSKIQLDNRQQRENQFTSAVKKKKNTENNKRSA